ncbi:histidine kinase [Paenibacillus sp. HB172176]|uniref:sensor histidine kinase n=1 Tax=Paenibacillus sp. HB172176 TaxID=2493690 RepID=UPI00143BA79F|nr:histidine kinase [Paenibacillus sp. HB172176]
MRRIGLAKLKLNVFQKILIMIAVLLMPIMGLYYYATQQSLRVIQDELIKANLNKMGTFMIQLENSLEKFELVASPLLIDTNLLEYEHDFSLSGYTMLKTVSMLQEKLALASISSNLHNNVTIYLPRKGEAITSDTKYAYDREWLKSHFSLSWQYGSYPNMGLGFARYFMYAGEDVHDPETAVSVLSIEIYQKDFEKLLDTYKEGNVGDPFLYRSGQSIIESRTANTEGIAWVGEELKTVSERGKSGHLIREWAGNSYLISYYKSDLLGAYLVDYFPLDRIIQPIVRQRVWFGVISALILMTGIAAASILFRSVQIPVLHLIRGVKRIKSGDFSYRLIPSKQNEFQFLTESFNEMTEQIQNLIENELRSRIQARDATLKQLQAQIHPHFLYNCLGFMINMTRLGKHQATIDMAHHLADYYRYSTRMDNQVVSLSAELAFVQHYLEIHRLRMDTLEYIVDSGQKPDEVHIPRFLIQPIVENALVHGLESVDHPGKISIRVQDTENRVEVMIEDNGEGMSKAAMLRLQQELSIPADDYSGCGLWNVYQRMMHYFGDGTSLIFDESALGGLRVTLGWNRRERRESDVQLINRG